MEPFLKKETIWINDTNNGSYTSQLQFDFSQIANSAKWASWSEATLEIPFTIVVDNQSGTDVDALINSFMVSLRNGSFNLINSLTVTYNNTNIVQLTDFTNHFVSFKLMTSLSQSDLDKWSGSLYFSPDGTTSFQSGTGPNGVGFTNNRPSVGPTGQAFGLHRFNGSANEGLAKRCENVVDLTSTSNFYSSIIDSAKCTTQGLSFFKKETTNTYKYSILATIRLKDVCDVFDKMPMVKGAFITAQVNYNASSQAITSAGSGAVITCSVPSIVGQTNPLIVNSADVWQPNEWLQGVTGTFYVNSNIVSAKNNSGTSYSNDILTASRLSIPLYTCSPQWEEQYVSQGIKEIFYSDIYSYTIKNIAPGGQINQLVTNGISQPLYVVVIPYIAKSSTGCNLDQYVNPFASEPGTTSPCGLITQFNIQVSGSNIFQQSQQYDYDTFLNELRSINAINGGNSTGLTSGLIDQTKFQFGLRYYVADLSRRLPKDDISRSIQILGTNNTSLTFDYMVFVAYQRSLKIDLRSGALVI
jgi:hypothetical protein